MVQTKVYLPGAGAVNSTDLVCPRCHQRDVVGREAAQRPVVRGAGAEVGQRDPDLARVHRDGGRAEPVVLVGGDGDLLDAVGGGGGAAAGVRLPVDRTLPLAAGQPGGGQQQATTGQQPGQRRVRHVSDRTRIGCAGRPATAVQPRPVRPAQSVGDRSDDVAVPGQFPAGQPEQPVDQAGGETPDEQPGHLEARPDEPGRVPHHEPVGRLQQLGQRQPARPRPPRPASTTPTGCGCAQ